MKEKKKDQPGEGPPAGQAQADDESSYEDPVFEDNRPEMETRADAPYLLDIDGSLQRGQLDADGRIEISIPPNAREASLILNPGTGEEEVVPLALGAMDPVDEVSGVRRRLCNLGFACSPEGDEMTDDLEVALRTFQEKSGIQVTAVIDQATKEKLKEHHGS
jgi:hypothetical protein